MNKGLKNTGLYYFVWLLLIVIAHFSIDPPPHAPGLDFFLTCIMIVFGIVMILVNIIYALNTKVFLNSTFIHLFFVIIPIVIFLSLS